MADISAELQEILDAVYGEEVRGSIHDAIALINSVGEKNITLGTDITSASSSIEGYYDGSVYINTDTYIMWVCDGTAWVNKGSLKGANGADGADGASLTATSSKSGKITTVTISNADTGEVINTFQIRDGADGSGGGGASSWDALTDKPFESVGTDFKTDNSILALSSGVKAQIANLDPNGKISASNVLDTDGTTAITQKLAKLNSIADGDDSDGEVTQKLSASISGTNSKGDAWVSSKAYVVGDMAIYNNELYYCKTAHTSLESFTSGNWIKTSLSVLCSKFISKTYSATSTHTNVSAAPLLNVENGKIYFGNFIVLNADMPTKTTIATYSYTPSSEILVPFYPANGDGHSIMLKFDTNGNLSTDNRILPNIKSETYYTSHVICK